MRYFFEEYMKFVVFGQIPQSFNLRENIFYIFYFLFCFVFLKSQTRCSRGKQRGDTIAHLSTMSPSVLSQGFTYQNSGLSYCEISQKSKPSLGHHRSIISNLALLYLVLISSNLIGLLLHENYTNCRLNTLHA